VAHGVGPEFKPQHCKKKKKVMSFVSQESEMGHVERERALPAWDRDSPSVALFMLQ
jgi:hypothetical protein